MVDERRTEDQAGTLRDLLIILFKHKTKIASVFLTVVVIVTMLSLTRPLGYAARSSVLIKFGREYVYRPEVGDRNPMISVAQTNQEEILNSEIEIITNRDLMEKVITAIGVDSLYPGLVGKTYSNGATPKDAAIVRFARKLSVEGVRKSNVINVSFEHEDPRLAARVVNLLVEFFREKHLQVYSDPQSSFLEHQLSAYQQKLKVSEDALQAFKQERRVYALDDQRRLMLEQRITLDNTYKETQNNVTALQEKLRSLKTQARTISEDGNTFAYSEQGKIITDAKGKLLELQLKEQDLLARYRDDSPLLKDVRKQIQMTRDFLDAQEKDVTTKVRPGNLVFQETEKERVKTEADLRAQEAKLASLVRQIAGVEGELKNLDSMEKQFLDLKRDTTTNDKNYQNYLDKYEEARISDDMNRKKMANISVIQAAAVPTEPVRPKRAMNIALSIVLGLAAGLGVGFFTEYVGHTFNTGRDVDRRLDLPVLASVTRFHA